MDHETVLPLTLLPLLLLSILCGCAHPPEMPQSEPARAPVWVDHHVHLLSPRLVRDWKSLGVPFSRPDSAYTSAAVLLEAPADDTPEGVKYAVLLPMAHLYGRADFRHELGLKEGEEYERVRQENDHVAREASLFPGRAAAFCGVDFLRPYAWEEIHRCRRELGSVGLKLHLASAGADLRNPEHLDALVRIAVWAESEGVALMIHFDPQQRGLEAADVRRFLDVVLEPVPELVVVIPHLGGSGGYGPWTQIVFGTFIDWLEAGIAVGDDRPGVLFDLSAVWLEEESEGVPPSTEEEATALRKDLRRIGLERILFGSDYPVFHPQDYAGALRKALGVDPEEWETLMGNRIPAL